MRKTHRFPVSNARFRLHDSFHDNPRPCFHIYRRPLPIRGVCRELAGAAAKELFAGIDECVDTKQTVRGAAAYRCTRSCKAWTVRPTVMPHLERLTIVVDVLIELHAFSHVTVAYTAKQVLYRLDPLAA